MEEGVQMMNTLFLLLYQSLKLVKLKESLIHRRSLLSKADKMEKSSTLYTISKRIIISLKTQASSYIWIQLHSPKKQ